MPCPGLRFTPTLLLALGSACGPFVILETTGDESSEASETSGDVATTAATSSTTSATTSPQTTSVPTTSATTTPQTTSVDPTGDEPGYCAEACMVVDDCLYPGSVPEDWACTYGFCEYVGESPPCEPATCDDLMIGTCTMVEGVSLCATPCVDDSACLAGLTACTGVDDFGSSICEVYPCVGFGEGEACVIDGFGQIGVCIDGECSCTDDTQCTAPGYACNE